MIVVAAYLLIELLPAIAAFEPGGGGWTRKISLADIPRAANL
jgi:hypothetical protein